MKTRTLLSFIAVMLLFGFRALANVPVSVTITPGPYDTVCSGTSVTFTANITGIAGSGTYGYIWNVNGSFVGSSASTYTSTTLTNGAQVHCVLTNVAGDTIYTISDTVTMTVDSLAPIAAITGLDSVCIGDSVQLSDATTGGIWTSSNAAAATVSIDGAVTGLSIPMGGGPGGGGAVRIMYKVTNGCGTDSVRVNRFYVRAPASAITASTSSICIDSTVALSDATAGGVWSISNTAIASFPPFAIGVQTATGEAAGTVTIAYNVTNACGIYTETVSVTVINCDTSVTGAGVKTITSLAEGCNIYPNPSTGICNIMVRSPKYNRVNCIVSNMVGEKVKEFTLSTNQENVVDMSTSSGVYFITISAGNEKYTSKMVVIQ